MKFVHPIPNFKSDQIGQLVYASYFVNDRITQARVENGTLVVEHDSSVGEAALKEKFSRLVKRFDQVVSGLKENIIFSNDVETPYQGNIIRELLDKKVLKELGEGLYIFREPFTILLRFFDYSFTRIGRSFEAKEEYYPAVIHGTTLDKTAHFTSFPEHIHFLTHLREDLDVIEGFAETVRSAGGWKNKGPIQMEEVMIQPQMVMNPATCYHCYEGLQDQTLEGDGVCVTAVSKCHRYESRNHREFGRLLDFTMREIIFVGKPPFVIDRRMQALKMAQDMAAEWKINLLIENANDLFFSRDFQEKAAFQRNQEMKYEFRLKVPYIDKSLACASSNFHNITFGSAFNIKAGKRHVVTSCLAFGLERWTLAFLSQFGLDQKEWPASFRDPFEAWKARSL